MPLSEAVRRVAGVIGKRPIFVRMPVWFHRALAQLFEATMRIPLLSSAQVCILSEGIVEALPVCGKLPADLLPTTRFSDEQIRRGLPKAGTLWSDAIVHQIHLRVFRHVKHQAEMEELQAKN